jgi:hypothetical protein
LTAGLPLTPWRTSDIESSLMDRSDAITRQERSKSFLRKADADALAKLVDADQLRGLNVPAAVDGLKTVAHVVARRYEVQSPTLKPKTAHSYANLITSRIVPRARLGAAQQNSGSPTSRAVGGERPLVRRTPWSAGPVLVVAAPGVGPRLQGDGRRRPDALASPFGR